MKKYLNFFLILFIQARLSEFIQADETESPILAAYYENWSQFYPGTGNRKAFSIDKIDPSLLTDLYYAFAIFGFITPSVDSTHSRLTEDFKIQPLYANEQNSYKQMQELKRQTGGRLRTFLSIGGSHFNDPADPYGIGKQTYQLFSQMVSNRIHRKQFIESAIQYAHQYDFNGIDIDWEYPGDSTKGGTSEDFEHFLVFLKECSEAFHAAQPPLLLSFAASASIPSGLPQSYLDHPDTYYQWLAECAKYLDRMTIMAYNYHTPFESPKITGANAPLFRDTNPASYLYIVKTLDNFLKNGVSGHKILLGLPLYGWSYEGIDTLTSTDHGPGKPFKSPGNPGLATKTPGLLAYFEIADRIAVKQLKLEIDSITNTAYGYNISSKQWVSFDVPDTIGLKVKEAKKQKLGGVAFWAIDLDEYQWEPRYPNIRAAFKIMREP